MSEARSTYERDTAMLWYATDGSEDLWRALLPAVRRHSMVVAASAVSPLRALSLALALSVALAGQMVFPVYARLTGLLASTPRSAIVIGGMMAVASAVLFVLVMAGRVRYWMVAVLVFAAGLAFIFAIREVPEAAGPFMVSLGGVIATYMIAAAIIEGTPNWVIPLALAQRGVVLTVGEFVVAGVASLLDSMRGERQRWQQPLTQKYLAQEFRSTASEILKRVPALARWRGEDVVRARRRAGGVASLLIELRDRLSDARSRADYDVVWAELMHIAEDANRGDWTAAEAAPQRSLGRGQWFRWQTAARLLPYIAIASVLPFLPLPVPGEVVLSSVITLLVAAVATIPWTEHATSGRRDDTPVPRAAAQPPATDTRAAAATKSGAKPKSSRRSRRR